MLGFFSNQPSQAPVLSLPVHAAILLSLPLLVWLTGLLKEKWGYQLAIKGLQLLQLVAIYSWYALAVGFPLKESLPLYHCRTAMVVMLLAKSSKIKDYFAFLGIGGSLAALIYPVFDPYPFWHVTIFSLILGHLALWANSWAYLLTTDRRQTLSIKTIVLCTLAFNAFLVLVNQLTGGNYGFLTKPPLLNTTNLLVNYVAVTGAVVALIVISQFLYTWLWQQVNNR